MSTAGTVIVGALLIISMLGVIVPILPGVILAVVVLVFWAAEVSSPAGWLVFAVAVSLIAVSQVVKYLIPQRRLKTAGLPTRTQVAGVVLAVVGFFVIPVVGMFVGFPLGVYLAERRRLADHAAAKASTKHAIRATLASMMIELFGLGLAIGTWLVGVLFVV